MTVTVARADRERTATGGKVTRITFSPCGHQRSVGGWDLPPRYAVGREFTDCGQGPCIKAGA